MKFLFTFIALVLSASAHAKYQAIEEGKGLIEEKSFPAEDLTQLPANTIKYSWRFEDFKTWDGHEKKMLNLFEGYQQRTEPADRTMIVVIAKDTAILDKPANNVDLKPFIEVNKIRAVGMWNKPLSPEAVITRDPKRLLEYRNPPGRGWCDGGSNSSCVLTKLILGGSIGSDLSSKWDKNPEVKDHPELIDLIGQSEVRIYSGSEIQNVEDIQKLTKISATQVSAVMVQSGFWFSHAIGFTKTISVFQPLPSDPEHKTLVTSFFAFGIERKYWEAEAGGSVGIPQTGAMYLQGRSRVNDVEGLGQGIPKYTMNLMRNSLMMLAR